MFFRGYDAALGRMLQVDPMAVKYHDVSTYHYAGNNPVLINDPTGAEYYYDGAAQSWVYFDAYGNEDRERGNGGGTSASGAYTNVRVPTSFYGGYSYAAQGPGSGNHWSDGVRSMEGNAGLMTPGTFQRVYNANTDDQKFDVAKQAVAESGTSEEEAELYVEILNFEVISEDGNVTRLRALPSTWIKLNEAQQSGMTDFTFSNWALSIGGGVFGAMEGLTAGNDYWLGKNGKYYANKWGGNRHTGSRAGASKAANTYKTAGRVTVILSAGIGVYSTIEGYRADGGQFGYNAQKAAVSSAGSILGGVVGAEAGAALGAAVGVWFGGVGAIPGAVIGGVVGGFFAGMGGGYLGGKAGEAAVDYYHGR